MRREKENVSFNFIRFSNCGGITCETIGNPEYVLTGGNKSKILEALENILRRTTNSSETSREEVRRYAFGIKNKGRVLSFFRDGNKIVGFISVHLLNDGIQFLRYHGSTILHAGSGHILPEYQGLNLWQHAIREFLRYLPVNQRPLYVDGFTQSPRFLKLITIISGGRIHPHASGENIQDLENLQRQILPKILSEFGRQLNIKNQCVVEKLGNRGLIYASRIFSGDQKFDEFFYQHMDVNPERGDFLHFAAKIPVKLLSPIVRKT